MLILKKLTLAPLFLIAFALFVYQLIPLLKSYDLIFSLSINTFISLLILSFLISISCLLFVIFATLAQDLKIALPVSLISALIPMLFLEPALGLIFAVAIFISFLLTYLSLDVSLKSYLTFKPESILGPSIRHLSGLLILSFCLIYFLSTSKIIAQAGFQIPDSLIETALKMTPLDLATEQSSPAPQLPAISQEQIDLLKQNPELLRQSGLDPAILDTLNQPQSKAGSPQNLTQDLIKQTVKDQIQSFIKPYVNFVPAGLAILLFLTLQSLTSLINLLIYPLLWIIFYILEKTGFVKFETEQRPVRKMIV
ncbi:hypothetical protein A2867_02235 [Candidatus Daviesbacteria bacterium RIFCSPHIGHO2_01_FULL_40_11]|uniref:Uncharacterized protein n=1 Tax=Candidatus Daviesbacteria bacterium RIFCSPHIGHO2_01_FULL_40_11 TaxID=1797762 RepID=A0A1F5JM13_9BACT|nr:MAG: hypothetical protein A2867_02235 [Candidatus Daviesbacteria bacterium RIFCSPHIGHO2_01_FULL_40_11]